MDHYQDKLFILFTDGSKQQSETGRTSTAFFIPHYHKRATDHFISVYCRSFRNFIGIVVVGRK